jgi:uncharacterized phage protein gp47/JayE
MAITQITRSENEILRDVREKLLENIGVTADNATSTSLNLLKSTSRELATMWDVLNDLLRRAFPTMAYGDSLDEIGVLVQEPRLDAKRAMDLSTSNLQFYLDESYASNITDLVNRYLTIIDKQQLVTDGVLDSATNPSSLTFPAGVQVLGGSVSYTTVNPLTIRNTQLFDYTPIIANGPGARYNIGAGALNQHNLVSLFPVLTKIKEAIKVKNLFGIRNGGDTESDDNYRFRICNKVVSSAAGNESAVRKAVLSVPGIVDMSLIPRTHGNGTFTIFPKSQDPILSDGLITAVAAGVEQVKSVGTVVYVSAPDYLAVAMRIELRFAPGVEKDALYANTRLTIMDYINNLDLGGEIIINEIIQKVMSVDEKILDVAITQFGYGQYDRSTGQVSSFVPLRLMNQRADWSEKWYISSNLCGICQSGER